MKKITLITLFIFFCIVSCNQKPNEVSSAQCSDNLKADSVYKPTGEELKIVAIISVKPEAVKDIMPLFQQIVDASQQEPGCIYYNLHKDIKDSTTFIMLEEWKSQAAIDFHNNTEHFKAYKEATKDKIEKGEVKIMKLAYKK